MRRGRTADGVENLRRARKTESGARLAVELLAVKLPNRCGCQGRAFQRAPPHGGRRRRSLTAAAVWKMRALQELDGEGGYAGTGEASD